MELAQSLGILAVFLVFAGLMMARKLPALLALPFMAVVIAAIGGMAPGAILSEVIGAGATRLAEAIGAVLFGGILAQVVQRSGVAESLVKRAAELSGENAFWVSMALGLVCVLLFMALGGLGAVILVASLVFPVLLAVGVRPIAAGCLFLIAMSIGGILNPANWQFHIDAFGLEQSEVRRFAMWLFAPGVLAVVAFAVLGVLRTGERRMWAEREEPPVRPVPALAYLTPILPVVLVLGAPLIRLLPGFGTADEEPWEFPVVAAMLIGVVWGALTAPKPESGRVQLLSAAAVEGVKSVAPAVALMIGIGMLLKSVGSEPVSACLVGQDPVTGEATGPLALLRMNSPVAFVLVWGLLAPLALYRGPLNVWGMGIGVASVLVSGGVVPAGAAMAVLMSVGQIQGISDPTNTHNVWVASNLGLDVQDLLKRTLPYAWGLAVVGLVIGAAGYLG